jgi:DNA-binding response OmpR family regulator
MSRTRVLIVDDEPQITTLLRRFLERTGRYEVRTENRSRNALSAALEFRPQIVVLDVCMPEMDGPEVAQAIESIPEFKGVPLFFLTGLASPHEIGASGCDVGARVYLPKPIRMSDFLMRMEFACA